MIKMITKNVRSFYLIAVASIIALTGCNKVSQHDFDNLRDDVAKNTEEINSLKSLTASLQDAVNKKLTITSIKDVSKTENGETISGIEVTFSGDGGVKTIWNGSKGNTPFVWVNTNGNWASFMNKIPTDKDNATYELKDSNGKSIPAKGTQGADGFEIKVIDEGGYIAFQITNPNTGDVTVTKTNIPFSQDENSNIIESIVDNKYSVLFTIDKVGYSLMREISYPTSITMLQNTLPVVKGKTASFNIKVNPSNALVNKDMLSIGYVESMTRAASTDITLNPSFVKLLSCEAVDQTNTKSGEYEITLEWVSELNKLECALFIIANTTNNLQENIQVISSTPVFLTEKIVPIKLDFFNPINPIEMFQGEIYTDYITLTKDADGKDIWNKGYVSRTEMTDNSANIAASTSADDMFKFNVDAAIVDGTPTTTYDTKITIHDISNPSGKVDIDVPVKVYPLVKTLDKHAIANEWLPTSRKDNYVSYNIAQELKDKGFSPEVWDISCTSVNYYLDDVQTALPSSIAVYTAAIKDTKDIRVDILPEILEGTHKIEYNITAQAKEGKRPADISTKTFTAVVEFTVKAPVFIIDLKAGVDAGATPLFTTVGTRGTYTTTINMNVKADDVFIPNSCRNVSNDYKTAYNIANDAPNYFYVETTYGKQGLTFITFPSIPNWERPNQIQFYALLTTGQKAPVYITGTGNQFINSVDPKNPLIDKGVIDIKFQKTIFDHVAAPFKTADQARFNYSSLQSNPFNINDEFIISGQDVANIDMDKSLIASVKYEVLDHTQNVVNLPKKIIAIDAAGRITATGNNTWDQNITIKQPIKISMTDIWGVEKTTTVEIWLRSNAMPEPR